ncbi:hypothetical protein FRX31_010527 [Thalictrum thalictroides]|uniref:Uncharacterized protein n=1 Tax=Thalictrum thalictroides TaxID=46969 RepID=A0A7J6WR93_THATH|nr:hypothetical protein FRX31_010527 [Thalictrum thalictroides]
MEVLHLASKSVILDILSHPCCIQDQNLLLELQLILHRSMVETMNEKEKHNFWDDLLVVTETDYKNVYVEGKQKPCDLISLLPREEKGENVSENRNIGVIKKPTKVLISKKKPIFKNKGKKPMVSNSNKNEKNGVVEEPPKMPIPISEWG